MENIIQAKEVPLNKRINFFFKHFGNDHMIKAETYIYNYMRYLSNSYKGGLWNFYELSNGGLYISPASNTNKKMNITVPSNYFSNEVSSDAAGIIATLFALGALAGLLHDENDLMFESVSNQYHFLRDYALQHDEADLILSAVD